MAFPLPSPLFGTKPKCFLYDGLYEQSSARHLLIDSLVYSLLCGTEVPDLL